MSPSPSRFNGVNVVRACRLKVVAEVTVVDTSLWCRRHCCRALPCVRRQDRGASSDVQSLPFGTGVVMLARSLSSFAHWRIRVIVCRPLLHVSVGIHARRSTTCHSCKPLPVASTTSPQAAVSSSLRDDNTGDFHGQVRKYPVGIVLRVVLRFDLLASQSYSKLSLGLDYRAVIRPGLSRVGDAGGLTEDDGNP